MYRFRKDGGVFVPFLSAFKKKQGFFFHSTCAPCLAARRSLIIYGRARSGGVVWFGVCSTVQRSVFPTKPSGDTGKITGAYSLWCISDESLREYRTVLSLEAPARSCVSSMAGELSAAWQGNGTEWDKSISQVVFPRKCRHRTTFSSRSTSVGRPSWVV